MNMNVFRNSILSETPRYLQVVENIATCIVEIVCYVHHIIHKHTYVHVILQIAKL